MLFRAEILARNDEGVLERVLRVFRHRGYSIHSLHAICDGEQKCVKINIEGKSDRALSQLSLQVAKLFEVMHVSVDGVGSDLACLSLSASASPSHPETRRPVYASSNRG